MIQLPKGRTPFSQKTKRFGNTPHPSLQSFLLDRSNNIKGIESSFEFGIEQKWSYRRHLPLGGGPLGGGPLAIIKKSKRRGKGGV